MVKRVRADYLQQDVAIQQCAIPQATAVLFPCPVKVFLRAGHLIFFLSLLFNQVWVHTVFFLSFSYDTSWFINLYSATSSHKTFRNSYRWDLLPFCQIWLKLTYKFKCFCGQPDRRAQKDHTSLISLGNQAKNRSLPLIQIFSYCIYSLCSTQK